MPDLGNFLIEVATQPELRERFDTDAQGLLAERGLSPLQRHALVSKDPRRVQEAVLADSIDSFGVVAAGDTVWTVIVVL